MNTKGIKFLAVLAVLAMAFAAFAVISDTDEANAEATIKTHGATTADVTDISDAVFPYTIADSGKYYINHPAMVEIKSTAEKNPTLYVEPGSKIKLTVNTADSSITVIISKLTGDELGVDGTSLKVVATAATDGFQFQALSGEDEGDILIGDTVAAVTGSGATISAGTIKGKITINSQQNFESTDVLLTITGPVVNNGEIIVNNETVDGDSVNFIKSLVIDGTKAAITSSGETDGKISGTSMVLVDVKNGSLVDQDIDLTSSNVPGQAAIWSSKSVDDAKVVISGNEIKMPANSRAIRANIQGEPKTVEDSLIITNNLFYNTAVTAVSCCILVDLWDAKQHVKVDGNTTDKLTFAGKYTPLQINNRTETPAYIMSDAYSKTGSSVQIGDSDAVRFGIESSTRTLIVGQDITLDKLWIDDNTYGVATLNVASGVTLTVEEVATISAGCGGIVLANGAKFVGTIVNGANTLSTLGITAGEGGLTIAPGSIELTGTITQADIDAVGASEIVLKNVTIADEVVLSTNVTVEGTLTIAATGSLVIEDAVTVTIFAAEDKIVNSAGGALVVNGTGNIDNTAGGEVPAAETYQHSIVAFVVDETGDVISLDSASIAFTYNGKEVTSALATWRIAVAVTPSTGYTLTKIETTTDNPANPLAEWTDITNTKFFNMPDSEIFVRVTVTSEFDYVGGEITGTRIITKNAVMKADAIIPEGVSLIIEEGATLNMNGKTLTVLGTLQVKGTVMTFQALEPYGLLATILVAPEADVTITGCIAAGDNPITVAPYNDPESKIEYTGLYAMLNVVGPEFGFEKVSVIDGMTGKIKSDYYMTVSGTISKYTGTGAGKVNEFDATIGIITGALVIDAGVTLGDSAIYMAEGATLDVDGATDTVEITMDVDSKVDLSAAAVKNTAIGAYTGSIKASVSSSARVWTNLAETVLNLDQTSGEVISYVKGSTSIAGTKYDTYTLQLTGAINLISSTSKVEGGVVIAGTTPATVADYKPFASVTVTDDLVIGYNNVSSTYYLASLTVGETYNKAALIVEGEISMTFVTGKTMANYFIVTNADTAKSNYAYYTVGTTTTTTGYIITDVVSAIDAIAEVKDKAVTVVGTIDIKGEVELTTGTLTIPAGTFDVSGLLTVDSGATISGTINKVTGKVYVKNGATVTAPTTYEVVLKTGSDVAYCSLKTALADSVSGDTITLAYPVNSTSAITIPEGRTVAAGGNSINVKGILTIEGTLKTASTVVAYDIIVNGKLESDYSTDIAIEAKGYINTSDVVVNKGIITVAGEIKASGTVKAKDAFTISGIGKLAAIQAKDMNITGLVEAESAALTGKITVSGGLKVSGNVTVATDATISGTLATEGGNVVVTGKTVVTGILAVDGALTATGGIDSSAGLTAIETPYVPNAELDTGAVYLEVDDEDDYFGYTIITSIDLAVADVAAVAADLAADAPIALYGKMNGGEISLAKYMPLTVMNGAEITILSISVDKTTVTVNATGKLTAYITGASGEENGTVSVSKAQNIVFTQTAAVTATSTPAKLTISGTTIKMDSVEIVAGEVYLAADLEFTNEAADVGIFTVDMNAAAKGGLKTPASVTTNVNGTFIVDGTVTLAGPVNVSGTFAVPAGETANVTGVMKVSGIVAVSYADVEEALAAGIFVATDLTVSGEADLFGTANITTLTVSGDAYVDGTVGVITTLTVSGSMDVLDDTQVTVTNLYVTGELDIAENAKVTFTKAYIGTQSKTVGAVASINGPITLATLGSYVIVYDASEPTVLAPNGQEAISTVININGGEYLTVYAAYGNNVDIVNALADVRWGDIEGVTFTYDAVAPIAVPKEIKDALADAGAVKIGSVESVGVKATVNTIHVRVSIGTGISVFVDGVKVEPIVGIDNVTVGNHTLVVSIDPGYKGTTSATFAGKAVTTSFTVTNDMIVSGDEQLLSVTGDIQIDNGDVPAPEQSEWTIATILLVVLVILIAVMIVVLVLRLNRN